MEEIMLKIENVKKEYKLGQIGGTTLRDEFQRLHAKIHKKEDPTRKIGAKNYNQGEKFLALDGVSFEVKKGERVGIIGHNGAGKSTLLKLISRITAPTEGTISLNGRIASMLEVGTGFHPELTGRENVYMNGAILGMTKKEIDTKMEDIIEFSEVRQFIDTPVKRYSSGMYVKLAFSVAAHLDSEIMIMDEVLAVGDIQFQQKCIYKMNQVSQDYGRTILYVSHNMNTIRQLCDRVIVLSHGKIIFNGDVEEGIRVYSGEMNIVCGDVDLKGVKRNSVYSFNEGFRFNSFELQGVQEARYIAGEVMKFKMDYSCTRNLDNVFFRIMVYFVDKSVIGKIETDTGIKLQETVNGSINFHFDTSVLAPGTYSLKIYAYGANDFGSSGYYDIIDENILNFEIVKDSKEGGVAWNHLRWGHIDFKKLNIEVCN